jgi:hypothetical protein
MLCRDPKREESFKLGNSSKNNLVSIKKEYVVAYFCLWRYENP